MKTIKTTLLLLFMSASATFGQSAKKYEKYLEKSNYRPGYIETVDGSRIAGLLKNFSGGYQAYSKVVFVSEQGEKNTYYPYHLNAYGTDYEQYESNRHHFLKVVTKSNGIGLYKLAANNSWSAPGPYGGSMVYGSSATSYYVKRTTEEEHLKVRRRKFVETFSDYFSDCAKLQEEISRKKLTHKHVREIVEFYQYSCREQEAMNISNDRF